MNALHITKITHKTRETSPLLQTVVFVCLKISLKYYFNREQLHIFNATMYTKKHRNTKDKNNNHLNIILLQYDNKYLCYKH